MQKVIIVLFLAISFVMMTLISYMKFQTMLYLESTQISSEYYVDSYQVMSPDTSQTRGYWYS